MSSDSILNELAIKIPSKQSTCSTETQKQPSIASSCKNDEITDILSRLGSSKASGDISNLNEILFPLLTKTSVGAQIKIPEQPESAQTKLKIPARKPQLKGKKKNKKKKKKSTHVIDVATGVQRQLMTKEIF
jgi:hypothetical protein